jgi:glyoxylase-like metal-dependent hydrolase (beta-lactamase superfamily II)
MKTPLHTLDLHFQGIPGAIAAYLIPHAHGAILVESGPGSTQATLSAALAAHGFALSDITHVLLTHIHLDHAGAAGWLANQGAQIFVHHVGAPHLLDPTKLIASATRIYGDMMQPLWGDFLPVPAERLTILHDEDVIEIGDLRFQALDTPGHAFHHMAYLCEDTLFSGDVGGVRLQGYALLSLPMPPPEFHLELWRDSLRRLAALELHFIAPTHFGVYADPAQHLANLAEEFVRAESWMLKTMHDNPPVEALRKRLVTWVNQSFAEKGIDVLGASAYEAANPAFMSADGIYRYWHKVRNAAG